MWFDFSFGLGALVIVVILAAASIKILREYERAVVFLLGRFQAVKGPGLIIIIPVIQQMVRAIARQAEAERERRAKVIHAEGELQAAEKLLQAATMLAQRTEAMQLRYLQTLTQIAGDKASTIVFPMPIDIIGQLLTKKEPQ